MSILNSSECLNSSKKNKVVRFSLNYDLRNLFLDFVNEKDRHLYEEFICKIRDLGQEIRDDELVQILKEARNCISILDRNFNLFVQVILLLKWSDRSDEAVREYQGFLLDLCSAHSYYSKNVIDHLVSSFKHGRFDYESGQPQPTETIPYQNIHQVIKTILNVIPMTRDVLISSINSSYPYIKKPSNEQSCYLYNTLQIITYAPSFRYEILKIIMQKITTIDVAAPEVENVLSVNLDYCLNILMRFIQNQCFDDGVLNFQKTKMIYQDLVNVFESILLTTYGTKHVQFVIFYVLSFKPVLAVGWLQLLWFKKVINPNVAPVIRQASVSYVASLLSRASYIPISLVRDMLSEMSTFAHSYISSQESVACVVQDTRIHGVFYSVCQAIFYVIAFRHKELVEGKKGLMFLNGLNLSKIVQSRLNPLRACEPAVARNFASITRNYQLAYCYSIIERNARSSLPLLLRDHSGNETIIQPLLETFFPFDPYRLPLSSKFIKPIYREYDEEKIDDEPMQQDEEDDFLDTTAPYSQSPKTSTMILSQSPYQSTPIHTQSMLSQSPKTSFLYGNHPGFLHTT